LDCWINRQELILQSDPVILWVVYGAEWNEAECVHVENLRSVSISETRLV
jgi:hypothetical protein